MSGMSGKDQNIDFWAHEKIRHCWDQVVRPKAGFFNTLAAVGKDVRSTLLTWISKGGFHPNIFYQTKFIRQELEYKFKVKVFLLAKRDDNKMMPGSTRIPHITGLAFALELDENSEHGTRLVDHPSASTKIARGWVYFLQ